MIGFNNKLLIHNTHVLDTYRTFLYRTEAYPGGGDVFYGVTNETDRTCGVLMPNRQYDGSIVLVTYPVQTDARHATSLFLVEGEGGYAHGAIYGHLDDFRRWRDPVSRVVPPTGVQYLSMYLGVFAVPQSGMTEIICTGERVRLTEKLSVVEPTLMGNLLFSTDYWQPEPDRLRITASTSWIMVRQPHIDSPYPNDMPMVLNGPLVPPLSAMVAMPYIDQDGHRFYGTIPTDPDSWPESLNFYVLGSGARCYMTM